MAIKMVEHACGANAVEQANKIEREALLSTSLSHPNVITTFKVSTMLASTAQALRSASSADTDWSAPSMPRNPRSPQQPGSASEGDGTRYRSSFVDNANSLHDDGSAGTGPGSAQATPRDSAMSEHGGGGVRMPQTPFSRVSAGGPGDFLPGEHDTYGRGSLSGNSPGGGAAAGALQPAFDSAASNEGRRAVLSRAEEGDYALSPEESTAEDDADAVGERCGFLKGHQTQECLPVGDHALAHKTLLSVGRCKSHRRSCLHCC